MLFRWLLIGASITFTVASTSANFREVHLMEFNEIHQRTNDSLMVVSVYSPIIVSTGNSFVHCNRQARSRARILTTKEFHCTIWPSSDFRRRGGL